MHIVLVEPEIHHNTGNIARTCSCTGTTLHLVRPLGFSTEDKYLKRAGLDYWDQVEIHYHDGFFEIPEKYPDARFHFIETSGARSYTEVAYRPDDFLVFGRETKGLSREILDRYPDCVVRIPMASDVRSLNLSNAAAIVLYEALRQTGFVGLE